MHLTAAIRATEFIKCIEGERLNIYQALDDKSQAQILKNEVLKSVAKTVYFGQQNLPLRGHCGDSQHLNVEHISPGNFKELLYFSCEAGDTTLKSHFVAGHRNAT